MLFVLQKVLPLNETSGIIEWIDNLLPLRNIMMKLYKERNGGKNLLTREDFTTFSTRENDPEHNKKSFDTLIARHSPPVFADYFVRSFPDPQTWYLARQRYVRTTAVMSMVGYLLGLGDRHAENIMIDTSNGDTVHVDLNCLFNKGDELRIPEVVPFRLTHNMVQAMGPTGFEGPFRKACEYSLGFMREQIDLLMTSLRPFYFDPLVDWVSSKKGSNSHGEVMNEKAVETLKAIQERLNGTVKTKRRTAAGSKTSKINLPLSVSGQVNFLINEATDRENLSQMYLGWAPYL